MVSLDKYFEGKLIGLPDGSNAVMMEREDSLDFWHAQVMTDGAIYWNWQVWGKGGFVPGKSVCFEYVV